MAEPLADILRRLKEERDEADRRYNDALTALDRAVAGAPDLPSPLPAHDEHQLAALNASWNILAAPPAAGGLRGRFVRAAWRLVGPYFQRQLTFNSQLVDHLNRNAAAGRAAQQARERTTDILRDQLHALAGLQARLIAYLQQVTAYVDTRDREAAAGALVVNAALNGVVDDQAKRWSSLALRDARRAAEVDAEVASLAEGLADLETVAGTAHRSSLTLKRELERLIASSGGTASPGTPVSPPAPETSPAFAAALDAYKYVGFEDRFRGSQDAIRERLESYVPYFEGAADVLDVGCGRGEFLDLLKARGIGARGLDLNHEMVEVCRARGLDAAEGNVVSYLESLEDGALGGLFAAQVVEHLQPGYLLRFLELAHHKLRPGARLVLETLNPACWVAFFDSFIRDITHVWPLHPDTLRYLVLASGFTRAEIDYRSPVPPQDKLQRIAAPAGEGLEDLVEIVNANLEKLNGRMFTYLDYAIVASR